MKYSDELLLHFTCDKCSMWWSIAISDNWNPTQDVPVGRSWFVLGVGINMTNLMKKFQSSSAVEQKTVNLFVVGSIPTSGAK